MDWRLFAATLVVLGLFNLARLSLRKGIRHVPGPLLAKFSSFYRFSLVRKGNAPTEYRRVHEKYGKIVRVGPNHVSVADPAMIPVIYGIGRNFTKTPFYVTMAPVYQGRRMNSLFTERDPKVHKALKSPVAQLFSMTNMRNYEVYADECTRIFMDAMRDLEGQPVDFSKWLQWYAFDVIGNLTFQRRFGFMEQRRDVDDMIGKIEHGLEFVKLSIRKRVTPDTMDKFMAITETEVDRYDRSDKKAGRTDFLSQLRAKEKQSGKIPPRDMINHLSNNLERYNRHLVTCDDILHHQTSTSAPKIVREIDDADKSGELSEFITYEECLKLPYLQATMREAMRVHPAVGFPLERYVPPEGAEICGVKLPAGTNVSISAPVVHVDKQVYGEDADKFRPERWLEASSEQLVLMDRSFLAFGYGSRTCIGKNISIMEMGKFVPQIFRHFDVEWASEKPHWHTNAAWFWKQSGLIVRLRKRTHQ